VVAYAFGRQKQVDLFEFEGSLVCRVNSRTARATQRNPVLEKKEKKKNNKEGERERGEGRGERGEREREEKEGKKKRGKGGKVKRIHQL
jgi:hypothetical protein